ncbi:hypothetical protein KUTeg_020313 [Tegillarca granosa]|uniref:Cyclic nucleotide-binding domain-containing protein n=1 Tax=Tegillarca granosa TaxID=220873 RepID=A0ABQ9E7H3_TEGGR|nr:hypothetical protein KUTeg_020313 [Tegillarca granosa]
MMNFEIPPGLTDLLQDFTVAVLKERPTDLEQFAADYFVKLNEKKIQTVKENEKQKGGGGVRFCSPPPVEPMQTDDDEEDDDEPMPEPPANRFARRKSVSAEGYDPEADDDDGDNKIVYPKSDEQRKRLNEAVRHILLFRSLEPVEPGVHVIDQGDDGDNFYVIDEGKYDIFVENKLVGNYDNRGSFGELALMYNMPRAATIVATTNGSLWAMDRTTFRRIVLKNAFNKRKMYETLLENVPLLKSLDPYERMNVADALVTRTFQDGDTIIKQGDDADCMYFIEEGQVRVTVVNKNDPSGEEVELKLYEKGGYFGELALVTHKPRAATARAVGKTKCAVLDVQAFERLMGPCMDVMKRNIDEYEEQLVQFGLLDDKYHHKMKNKSRNLHLICN